MGAAPSASNRSYKYGRERVWAKLFPHMSSPSLDYTLGALEVGILISTFLYSVTTIQVYIYFTTAARIPKFLRYFVSSLWVLESLHTIFQWYFLYRLIVTDYGNPAMLTTSHWTLQSSAFFDGLIGALVQGYFAYRIHVLSRKWIITTVSWTGSFLACAATTAITVFSTSIGVVQFGIQFRWLILTGLSIFLFVDFANTISLCIYLRIERTGCVRIDGIMNKMCIWAIETGLITTSAGLLLMIFCLKSPHTTLWISVSLFYAKLYSNALMASLNGREHLRISGLDVVPNKNQNHWTNPTVNSMDALELKTHINLQEMPEMPPLSKFSQAS